MILLQKFLECIKKKNTSVHDRKFIFIHHHFLLGGVFTSENDQKAGILSELIISVLMEQFYRT